MCCCFLCRTAVLLFCSHPSTYIAPSISMHKPHAFIVTEQQQTAACVFKSTAAGPALFKKLKMNSGHFHHPIPSHPIRLHPKNKSLKKAWTPRLL
ncbi:hypothetical protein BX070DRAFT_58177 [Coemansia spiralis]|nr:hypothetical protein BX070DRAFT_58177 [Coemansia spiralis]